MRLLSALRARLFGDGDERNEAEPAEAEIDAEESPFADDPLTTDESPAEDESESSPESQPVEAEPEADAPESDAPTPTFADAVPGRQERAAGRILDDEGLRGDLTDDEYQPLLDWALTVTDQLAAVTADLDDEQAEASLDAGLQAVRDALRAAQDAIVAQHEGRTDDQQAALDAVGAAISSLSVPAVEFPLAVAAGAPASEPEQESDP